MASCRSWLRWLPAEPRVLRPVGLLCVLVLAFLALAYAVQGGRTEGFDRAVLTMVRSAADPSNPIGSLWLKRVFQDITSLGSTAIITLITVIASLYLAVKGRMALGILVATAVTTGAIVEQAMKFGFNRARPDLVPHLAVETSLSFPSAHAMLSALTYLTISALLARAEPRARRQ